MKILYENELITVVEYDNEMWIRSYNWAFPKEEWHYVDKTEGVGEAWNKRIPELEENYNKLRPNNENHTVKRITFQTVDYKT